ncbi:hypothetical protein ACLOJK_014265 [Asimina triloba]
MKIGAANVSPVAYAQTSKAFFSQHFTGVIHTPVTPHWETTCALSATARRKGEDPPEPPRRKNAMQSKDEEEKPKRSLESPTPSSEPAKIPKLENPPHGVAFQDFMSSNPRVQRYLIAVEYIGTRFCGSQQQTNGRTVVGALEEAFHKFVGKPVSISCSSRTDAGVHALSNVCHVDVERISKRKPNEVLPPHEPGVVRRAVNHFLQKSDSDVMVIDVRCVPPDFHARFKALERTELLEGQASVHLESSITSSSLWSTDTLLHELFQPCWSDDPDYLGYFYRLLSGPEPLSTFEKGRAWHVPKELNLAAMQKACKILVGNHDFSSFRAAGCQNDLQDDSYEMLVFALNSLYVDTRAIIVEGHIRKASKEPLQKTILKFPNLTKNKDQPKGLKGGTRQKASKELSESYIEVLKSNKEQRSAKGGTRHPSVKNLTNNFYLYNWQANSPIRTLDELQVSEVAPSPYFPSDSENRQTNSGEQDLETFSSTSEFETSMKSACEINGTNSRAFGQMTRHHCFIVTARARSFLYHQVRLMVGVLKAVGTGDLTVNDVEAILNAKTVTAASPMAPACGLYLGNVKYDLP